MKIAFLTGALLLLGTPGFGAPCTPGNLQDYIDLGSGGCQIGSTLFSDFTTVPGQFGATAIGTGSVLVAPGVGPSLLFTLNASAMSAELLESIFRFSASGLLGSVALDLSGSSAAGDGAATAILDVCPDSFFAGDSPSGCPAGGASAVAFVVEGDALLNGIVQSAASSYDIFVDLTADGGGSGSATLGAAALTFAEVPEPSTLTALAAGLIGLGFLRRAKKGKKIHA